MDNGARQTPPAGRANTGASLSDLPASLRFTRAAVLNAIDSTRRPFPRTDAYAPPVVPRPRPRQMRPIEQRQNDPNAGVRLQAQQQAMRGLGAQRSQGALQRDLGRAEAYDPAVDPNTGLSQGQEALLMNLEITGGPSLVRSYRSFERGDMGGGFMHGGLGALAVLGNSTLSGPARRAGQARGALARPEPPFDTRTRYYHGMHGTVEDGPGAWDGGALRPTQGGRYGDAVYLSPSRATADQYASLLRSHGRADRPGDVIEAHVRGRFASESRFQAELNRAGGDKATAVARLRRAGFAGVRAPGENQIAVFDPADVRVVSPPPARPEPFPDFGTAPPRPAPRGLDASNRGGETLRIYRGTPNATTQWRPSRHRPDDEHMLGEGVYATTNRSIARDRYAVGGGTVHEADLNGALISEAEWTQLVRTHAQRLGVSDTSRGGWTRAERAARKALINDGYVGIRAAPDNVEAEIVIWPETRTEAIRPAAPSSGAEQMGRAEALEGEVLGPASRDVQPAARASEDPFEEFASIREEAADAHRQTRGMIHIIDILLGERLATPDELAMMAPRTARFYLDRTGGNQAAAAAAVRNQLRHQRNRLGGLTEGTKEHTDHLNNIGQTEAALRLLEGPPRLAAPRLPDGGARGPTEAPTAGAGPPKPTQNKSYAARRKAGFFMPRRP